VKHRKCKKCGRRKNLETHFRLWRSKAHLGKEYRRHTCKACESSINVEYKERHAIHVKNGKNKFYLKMKEAVYNLLGHSCTACGFSDWRALQVDHVLGNGAYMNLRLGTKKFFEYVKAHATEFQVLCANCNWIKRYEQSEGAYHNAAY
jgi:RNase P subunit RPR2